MERLERDRRHETAAAVAAVLVVIVVCLIGGLFVYELIVHAWPFLLGIVAVFAVGLGWAKVRGRG